MIKGALFDIDDTLFSHDIEAVPSLTLKALDKLREKGIKIGICTSRIIAEMAGVPEELLKRVDCKIMGTGSTTMVDGVYYKSYTIDMDDAKKYTDYFNEHNISYTYTDINGDAYYWGDLDKVNDGLWLRYAHGNVKFKKYEDEEITNIFFYRAKDNEVIDIQNINSEALISLWGTSGNICAPLIDKSFGLLKFCQVFSLTTDEVLAAGDGSNDDVMLKMAGIGVAVSDAKDNTKACADYVCKKSIEDGGLYDAFIDLGIIEEDKYESELFVFDNDSTLFDHSIKDVREKTYLGLEKLKQKGYKLCLNTSRSFEECYNIPKKLIDMMDAIILLDGAYTIVDNKVNVTYLDDDVVKNVIDYMDTHDITYRYCLDNGRGYLNRHDEKEKLFKDLYNMIPDVKKYEGERVIHLLYYANEEDRNNILKLAKNEEHCQVGIASEISPIGKNKGLSMLDLAKEYNIKQENICAFGDNGNDLQMLELAGLGIAMGNGSVECKQAADYITDHISDEGIYNALVHFRFID